MGYGFAGYFGWARETTWGSATNATRFIEILNEDVHQEIERFDYKNVIGTLATPDDKAGVRRVIGSVAFAGNPEALGPALMSVFNTVVTTSLAATLHRHVYKQPTSSNSAFSSTSPSVPYTLEIFRDVNTTMQYAGAVVSNLSLNFAPNQDVRASIGIIGRSERSAAYQTPTFPGSPTIPFTFDTVSLSLAGAANTKIENLTVTIDNQYEGIPALDLSTWISKIRRTGHQTVMINGTLDFSDTAEYNDFIAQTERQLVVSATLANSFSLVVDVPRMVYTSFPLGIGGKERLTVDFEGKGFYHTGSGTGIAVTLTTVSSYF